MARAALQKTRERDDLPLCRHHGHDHFNRGPVRQRALKALEQRRPRLFGNQLCQPLLREVAACLCFEQRSQLLAGDQATPSNLTLAPRTPLVYYVFAAGLGFTWLATVPPTAAIIGKLFGVRYLGTLFGLTLLSHQTGGFLGAWLGGLARVLRSEQAPAAPVDPHEPPTWLFWVGVLVLLAASCALENTRLYQFESGVAGGHAGGVLGHLLGPASQKLLGFAGSGVLWIAAMVAGTPDLSQIPLGNIERVEYIRGPRAAVYGSDAIGGVINLITKTSAKSGSETHLKGGAGSHGYGQGQLRTVQALGQQTDMNLLVGYERTDGFDVVAGAQQPAGRDRQRVARGDAPAGEAAVDHQAAAVLQGLVQCANNDFLRFRIHVDQRIATKNNIELTLRWRRGEYMKHRTSPDSGKY